MEEWDQKAGNVFDYLRIVIPFSATCFLEVGAHHSLKVATKVSIKSKNNFENIDFSVVFL